MPFDQIKFDRMTFFRLLEVNENKSFLAEHFQGTIANWANFR
jgi:hypothetical protein